MKMEDTISSAAQNEIESKQKSRPGRSQHQHRHRKSRSRYRSRSQSRSRSHSESRVRESFHDVNAEHLSPPLRLEWSFGFATRVPCAVHTLQTQQKSADYQIPEGQQRLAYLASHTLVIHTLSSSNEDHVYQSGQILCRGHLHELNAMVVARDKTVIITADCAIVSRSIGTGSIVNDHSTLFDHLQYDNKSNAAIRPSSSKADPKSTTSTRANDVIPDDCTIIAWDTRDGSVIKVIPAPSGGVIAMDLSADGSLLAVLSASYPNQMLSIYDWTSSHNGVPITSHRITSSSDFMHCVRFNPVLPRDIVTNGLRDVIFWNWRGDEDELVPIIPSTGLVSLEKSLAQLTQTVFLPYSTRAVTATSSGYLVLWDYSISELVQSNSREAIKVLHLMKSGVDIIDTVLDMYIVCGCHDGAIRFFDFQLRIVAWYEDLKAGPITSISFADNPAPQIVNGDFSSKVTSIDNFNVPKFVVATANGHVIELDSYTTAALTAERRKGRNLIRGFDGDVMCADTHPSLPLFAVGTSNGTLMIWDMDERYIAFDRTFDRKSVEKEKNLSDEDNMVSKKNFHATRLINVGIQSVKFSSDGSHLAVGFANGALKIISGELKDVATFKRSNNAITHLCWSMDSEYVAYADMQNSVSVFRFWHKDDEIDKPFEWFFVGKHRSHTAPVLELLFEDGQRVSPAAPVEEKEAEVLTITRRKGSVLQTISVAPTYHHIINADSSNRNPLLYPRLFSLAEDRILQEYDLANSSIRTGLILKRSTIIEQTASPTAFLVINSLDQKGLSSDSVITANDEYKLKQWKLLPSSDSAGGSQLNICGTTAGPTYGGPLTKLLLLKQRRGNDVIRSNCLLYSTSSRYIGLIQLPLDGNPSKTIGVVAHPCDIVGLSASYDGRFAFSLGGADRTVNVWSVDLESLAAQVDDSIQPFMDMLPDGKDGAFYQEMIDYFYYAQLENEGIATTKARQVTGRLPVDKTIPLLRALGFYPSEQQIRDLFDDLKHHNVEHMTLPLLIRTYVNYKPVAGISERSFEQAFKQLQLNEDQDGSVSTIDLIHELTSSGDIIQEDELEIIIDTLLGEAFNYDGAPTDLSEHDDLSASMKRILQRLPPRMTPKYFAEHILGFS